MRNDDSVQVKCCLIIRKRSCYEIQSTSIRHAKKRCKWQCWWLLWLFLELTAKLGEDEAFADGLIAENEALFDVINDEPMYYFYVEEDTENSELCQNFLKTYYEKAKQLVNN